MTRGLDASQISFIEDNATINETLMQIDYNGNSVYYTTGISDIDVETSTSNGVKTFVINPFFKSLDVIPELPFGNTARSAITFTGEVENTITALGVSPFGFVNVETKVHLHRLYRNINDFTVGSADPIELYSGFLVKKTYTVGKTTKTLQLEFMNRHRIRTVSPLFSEKAFGGN